ncbi:MAG: PRC-barrel domain-containing protein, partial [Bacillota bacterium]|nr:PRC-barrel domain-containing protein [Bacillota bacterium]
HFRRALRSPLPIIGARVFTAGGKNLGRVEEFHFSTADGHISGLEIAEDGFFRVRSLVDGSYIIAISTGTIMLKDQAIETAQPLEKSFMSGMENAAAVVLEKAADLKSNASQAGRRFSANFNEAMSRLKLREEEVEEAEEEAARTAQSVEEEDKELPEEKKE